MNNIDLNALRDRVYKIACDHGFHDKELSNNHFLMLVVTELSEAVEADRKGKRVLKDEKETYEFSQRPGFRKTMYENYIKGTVEEELADTVIRLLDLAGLRRISLYNLHSMISRKSLENIIETYEGKRFTENIFFLMRILTSRDFGLDEIIYEVIKRCFALSYVYDFNLLWHIEQKMKYNELREKMHGKKY